MISPARQIPLDALQAAGAEDAAHPAADLRADADRPPLLLGHQHAFDLPAVPTVEQQLVGAVRQRRRDATISRAEDLPVPHPARSRTASVDRS